MERPAETRVLSRMSRSSLERHISSESYISLLYYVDNRLVPRSIVSWDSVLPGIRCRLYKSTEVAGFNPTKPTMFSCMRDNDMPSLSKGKVRRNWLHTAKITITWSCRTSKMDPLQADLLHLDHSAQDCHQVHASLHLVFHLQVPSKIHQVDQEHNSVPKRPVLRSPVLTALLAHQLEAHQQRGLSTKQSRILNLPPKRLLTLKALNPALQIWLNDRVQEDRPVDQVDLEGLEGLEDQGDRGDLEDLEDLWNLVTLFSPTRPLLEEPFLSRSLALHQTIKPTLFQLYYPSSSTKTNNSYLTRLWVRLTKMSLTSSVHITLILHPHPINESSSTTLQKAGAAKNAMFSIILHFIRTRLKSLFSLGCITVKSL